VVLLSGWRLEHATGLPAEVHYADGPGDAVAAAVRLASSR
jgi:hypothetical protein